MLQRRRRVGRHMVGVLVSSCVFDAKVPLHSGVTAGLLVAGSLRVG